MCHREDVQALQRQYECLKREHGIIQKENHVLTSKLAAKNTMIEPPCCSDYGTDACRCVPGTNISSEMHRMKNEIETIGTELKVIQQEREKLSKQQQMLLGCHVCTPCIPCKPCASGVMTEGPAMHILEIKEQIRRLADDILSKKTEIECLHDLENELAEEIAQIYKQMETSRKEAGNINDKLRQKNHAMKRKNISKEQLFEQQQQIAVFKHRYEQTNVDMEDAKCCLKCHEMQLDEYRNLYIETQQMVEEQRRHIEIMELDNTRISDQVAIEIQRVKNQFQDRIIELSPLPNILHQTQNELSGANDGLFELKNKISSLVEEIANAKKRLSEEESKIQSKHLDDKENNDEINELVAHVDEWEKKYRHLESEIQELRNKLTENEEIQMNKEQDLEEKCHEVAQLEGQLETLREESARQVARTKERLEQTRRSLLCQIGEVERQLASARASSKSAMRDRDEIRDRMQCQINNLQGNFDEAQTRIRILQQNVGLLSNSYNNIFSEVSQPCPNFQALPCSNSDPGSDNFD